jgi:chromate transporter
MTTPRLPGLFLRFCLFSIMAVGGANALLPEIYRHAVVMDHWITSAEFATLFAISQAAPGPNVLIVALIGWKLQGLPGALACLVGMVLPSSLLAFGVGKLWYRFRESSWRKALERGLAPISVGLILGSGSLLLTKTATHASLWAVGLATAVAAYKLKPNPLWWLALAALLGAVGLV